MMLILGGLLFVLGSAGAAIVAALGHHPVATELLAAVASGGFVCVLMAPVNVVRLPGDRTVQMAAVLGWAVLAGSIVAMFLIAYVYHSGAYRRIHVVLPFMLLGLMLITRAGKVRDARRTRSLEQQLRMPRLPGGRR